VGGVIGGGEGDQDVRVEEVDAFTHPLVPRRRRW
jgi:hypothetical protein